MGGAERNLIARRWQDAVVNIICAAWHAHIILIMRMVGVACSRFIISITTTDRTRFLVVARISQDKSIGVEIRFNRNNRNKGV